jgi:two-component system, response regulator FlrC
VKQSHSLSGVGVIASRALAMTGLNRDLKMTKFTFQQRTMVIADPIMEKTIQLATRAARVAVPVLLCGESGTGKELIARYLHEKGPRASGPFISVNCAAIPDGLLEAELFGYERGAFTGAVNQRIGKFERANGGTLLLDEISEMSVALQAKLLRALQEGEVDRLGGSRPISINCRIVATTNRDPAHLIREQLFREDLYFRLNVIRIDCVPLRNREEAITHLTSEFVKFSSEREGRSIPTITPAAFKKLAQYTWPGNIRELQSAVERALLICDGSALDVFHFAKLGDGNVTSNEEITSLSELERKHITIVLERNNGNRTRAARVLGISVRTLRNKLKEYR